MAGLIERAASTIGSAVKAYRMAVVGDAKRPAFLSAWANQEKWKGGGYSSAKEEAQKRAIQNSWIFSAVNEKALEISNGACHIYRITDFDEDAPQIPNHPFEWILRRPNPFMGGSFLWQYTHWWLDLDGNSYWFLAPDETGQLAEVWPIPANRCWPIPGDKERFIDYYEYQVNGVIYKIPAENICHFRYANPFDIFRGLAPLVAGMLPVDADLAMARWNGSFFGKDNTMPSAVISLSSGNPASPIDAADIDAVRSQLSDEYSAAARKTIVTNAFDMAVQLLGYNAKDMDFLSGRDFTKEEIYQVLGYPPGYADKNSTEANATVGYNKFLNRIYNTHKLYSEQITAQIMVPWYGDDLEARFEDIRPVNKDMLLREAEVSKNDMTINERRKRYWKLPPIESGDVLLNNAFSDTEYPAFNFPQMNTQNGLPANARSLDLKNWKVKAIKALKNKQPAAVKFSSNAISEKLASAIQEGLELSETIEDIREVFTSAEKGIIRSWRPWSGFEERLASEVERALKEQAEEIIRKLRESGDPSLLDDPVIWTALSKSMQTEIEPILLELAARGVQRVMDSLGKSGISVNWELANQQATDWARQYSGDLITRIQDTTRQAVGEQVAEWTQSSEGLDGLIDRIAGMKNDEGKAIFSQRRAETIAITESTNTYASANSIAWQQAGYAPAAYKPAAHVNCRCYLQPWKMPDGTKVMVWYTARDERVCTQQLTTPWGSVNGCRDLHRTIVSEGVHMGKKI